MVYIALLRGINVGGKNKVPMPELKACLEELGFENVKTYINSGNVIFSSPRAADIIARQIEQALTGTFKLKQPIKVLVISKVQLHAVIAHAPKGFGEQPDTYHSDVAFLIGKSSEEAMGEI